MTPTQHTAMQRAVSAYELLVPTLPGLHDKGQRWLRNELIAAVDDLRNALAEPAPEPAGKLFHAKFNVGDRAWYMKNNAPTEVVISAVEVFFVNTKQDRITYNAKNVTNSVSWLDHTRLREALLFRSKAELLESL